MRLDETTSTIPHTLYTECVDIQIKTIIAIIASGLALIGNYPYVRDILQGKTKPHAYSWLVWSIVSATTFFGQLAKGAGVGAIPTLASEMFTIIIFITSLKYGFKHTSRTDTFYLVIALLGLIPWYVTRDPTISVLIVVTIDVIAFLPTISKTWTHPKTETSTLYGSNVLRHILMILSLEAYNTATLAHSVAMIAVNSAMWVLIKGRRQKV